MKEAINFLIQVYSDSIGDRATLLVAEADGDKETILQYLLHVRNYTERLISELKEK